MEIVFAIYAFVFGAILASFFGVICIRVPEGKSIVKPASRCDECGYVLKWYDNIPIISYLLLKGKCRKCGCKIGISSLVFEILGGLTLMLSFLTYKMSYESLFTVSIAAILFLIAMYDFKTCTILDIFWIIFLILSIGYLCYKVFVNKENVFFYLIGGGAGFIFFLLIKVIGKLIMKVDCLGGGDVIVMGIAGLILGPYKLLISVLVASVIGSIIELILIKVKKGDKDREIAFCPYLVLGIILAMCYGSYIIEFFDRVVI